MFVFCLGFTLQFEFVGIVHQPVQGSIILGRVLHGIVPCLDVELAAGADTMFRIGSSGEDGFNDFCRCLTGLGFLGDETTWSTVGILPMGRWHMFGVGGVFTIHKRMRVRCKPVPLVETLHRG